MNLKLKAKTNHPKMNQKFKPIWLAALRSGKYKRGAGELRQIGVTYKKGEHIETELHCCLGVAQHCATGKQPRLVSDGMLGRTLSKRLGLSEDVQQTLAGKNDSDRWSFKRIADWIEVNL
jgi:hypothetical protein